MSFWPKSRTARRRLTILLAVAPVLALATGLALYGMRQSISLFLTPAQAAEADIQPGQRVQLGGLVQPGSVAKLADSRVEFVIADTVTSVKTLYRGNLPDLFQEGKGVVAEGVFNAAGEFEATKVLAKHDEAYMPRNLENALKEQGEWRGEGAPPAAYQAPAK